jgi:hypothetical protein
MPKLVLAFISCFFLSSLLCSAQIQRDCLTNSGAITSGSASGLLVQQSIGQGSVIGNFRSEKLTLKQGFLQPDVLSYRNTKNEKIELEVFPNPFSETIQIQFTKAKDGLAQIRVFSADGALLKSFQKSMEGIIRLDLTGLAQGFYIVQVDTDDSQYATKIQKL